MALKSSVCSAILMPSCQLLETNGPLEQIPDIQTEYPDRASTEHLENSEGVARVAYPVNLKGGVWVKGSSNARIVEIATKRGSYKGRRDLSGPYWTSVFRDVPTDTGLVVTFRSKAGKVVSSREIVAKSQKSLNSKGKHQSVLFYGCLQPFVISPSNGGAESSIYTTQGDFPGRFIKTFTSIAEGERGFEDILPKPALVVGTGDQVYMDAGYESLKPELGKKHALSAWTVEEHPKLRFPEPQFKEHVARTYDAFSSLYYMNRVFSKLPQVNAWDDHEIRDGWGSQNDETDEDQKMKPWLDRVFKEAKHGYLEHQFSLGPQGHNWKSFRENYASMHQTFVVGDYAGFVFDLRSYRNPTRKNIIGPKQMRAFETWLNTQPKGQKVIIVSSMPLFLRLRNEAESHGGRILSEMKDDLLDGWAHSEHQEERDRLIGKFVEARNPSRNIKPIFVSGDYHKGSLAEIWVKEKSEGTDCGKNSDEGKQVLGYELVSSGLFHEGIASGAKAFGFSKLEAQISGQHISEVSVGARKYCIDPHFLVSKVAANFGGLEMNHGKGPDCLKLVVGSGKRNTANVFQVDLRWGDDFEIKKKKHYTTWLKIRKKITRYDKFQIKRTPPQEIQLKK